MPRYFNKFPMLSYTRDGVSNIATDLMTRISVIKNSVDEKSIFYQYDIQEGDTPEIIASKYYNDPELHWVVLVFNNIFDPFYDWPMTYLQFSEYIADKYGSQADALETVHHYEKIVTSIDGYSGTATVNKYIVDLNTYTNLIESSTTKTFENGYSVTVNITKRIVDCYTYEEELNESKRKINLLKKDLIPDIKNQFKQLMGA